MQNMLQLQDDLKNFSEQQLVREMQMPSGQVPQFLILTELGRRKRMKDDFTRQQAANTPTVAEETVAAAGMPVGEATGIAKSMAPKTSMAENTGIGTMMPRQPTRMAGGGVVKMQTGGLMSAVAMLKTNYPEVYEEYKDDPNALAYIAKTMAESVKEPELTALEQMEAPRSYDTLKNLFTDTTNRAATKNQSEIAAGQPDRAIQAQIDTANRLRGTTEDDPLFTEGTPVNFLPEDQVYKLPRKTEVSAIEGSLSAPEAPVISLPSAAAIQPVKTQAGNIPFVPPSTDSATIQGSPTTDFSIEPGSPAETDAIREYLRGEGSMKPSLIDDLDRGAVASDRIREDSIGARESLYFPTSNDIIRSLDEEDLIPDMLNRRAQEYLQSDMYTPPEEIYDLGPKGRIKYETEDPAERDKLFAETAQREFLERQAADAAADARIPEGPNMETELRDARVADLIGGKISDDNTFAVPDGISKSLVDAGADLVEGIGGVISDAAKTGSDMAIGTKADRSSEVVLGDGAEFIDPATTQKAKIDADKAALDAMMANTTGTGSKSGSGSGRGGAGGGLEGQLADMIKETEKNREQDKWLALANTGLALMASKSPTLGGALGEAGMAGMKQLQEGKKQYSKDKMTILALQQRIDASKRAAASKSTGLTASQSLTRGLAILKQGQDMMENAQIAQDPMAAERAQQLINYGNALMGIPNIGSTGTGAIKAPSAS